MRYMPMFRMLKETVDSGKIGAVTAVTANLGYALLHKERVTRPELAGGALLDLGVYTLNLRPDCLAMSRSGSRRRWCGSSQEWISRNLSI